MEKQEEGKSRGWSRCHTTVTGCAALHLTGRAGKGWVQMALTVREAEGRAVYVSMLFDLTSPNTQVSGQKVLTGNKSN